MNESKAVNNINKSAKILMHSLIFAGLILPFIGNFLFPAIVLLIFYKTKDMKEEYLKIVTFHLSLFLYLGLPLIIIIIFPLGIVSYFSFLLIPIIPLVWLILGIVSIVCFWTGKRELYIGDILYKFIMK